MHIQVIPNILKSTTAPAHCGEYVLSFNSSVDGRRFSNAFKPSSILSYFEANIDSISLNAFSRQCQCSCEVDAKCLGVFLRAGLRKYFCNVLGKQRGVNAAYFVIY